MKKSILFTFLLISSIFISCSNENESGNSNFNIPLVDGNYWTYDVDSEGTFTRDSLYIFDDIVTSGKTYKKFQTKDDVATGFYSSSLRNNGVRKSGSKLLMTGNLSLASGQDLPINLDLSLTDFVIFNSNASNGQSLNNSPVTGTIEQTYQGYPITINYSLQSYGGESLSTFTSPNGDIYDTVKATKIKLNVTVTTVQTIGSITIPITILAPQDLIISTLYTAENIGVVYVNTDTNYSINSTIADQFGIPATGSQNQKEYLDLYLTN
ncbi:hypothetical protein [Flavobacterium proteolyticum]|uniref:Lipoprotein n=1 Tax=Flavobacterium proteolyticum TaxID=2911683 RepID=A0ABR9WRP8_9FLAO|nr:hypothetical protein [Flavobacterium proteolyticum]MBE9576598.1 hypothetical protein [Flavobacterium proteolyticum]